MKLSRILIILLFVCTVMSWVLFAVVGERGLVDLISLCLMSLVNATLIFSLATATSRTAPIVIIWPVVTTVDFSTRFIALILDPEQILLGNRFFFGVEDMIRALLYILPAMILTAVGFALGGKLAPSRIPSRRSLDTHSSRLMKRTALIGIASVILGYAGMLFFDVANFSSNELEAAAPWWYSMASIFLNQDAVCMISIAITGEHWRKSSKVGKRRMRVFFGMYVLELLLCGTRAVFARPLFWILQYLLAKKGDIKFSSLRALKWFVAILIAIVFIFPIATSLKIAWNSGELIEEQVTFMEYAITRGPGFGFSDLLSQVSFHKAGLDTLIIIVNQTGPEVSEYLSPKRQIKYLVNKLIPGWDPFPEATLQTSRLFAPAYRGWSLEFVKRGYNSDLWTLWGLSYAQFGLIGSFIMIFLISFLLSWGYQWVGRAKSSLHIVWRVLMLSFITSMLLSQGFETSIWLYSHQWLSVAFMLALMLRSSRTQCVKRLR